MPCIRRETKRSLGFTLIEMLMVTVIMAMVALAIYAAFNNATKILSRVNAGLSGEDTVMMLDKFSQDVSNALTYKDIDPSGTEGTLELATLVKSPRLGPGATVGKVIYYFDAKLNALVRQQHDLSSLFTGETDTGEQALKNVRSALFHYYFYDAQKKEYYWQNEWQKGAASPVAIKVELDILNGDKTNIFSKTANMPIGR